MSWQAGFAYAIFKGMDWSKQRWQIFWLAVLSIGGTAFALGVQLCLSIISGYGWWKFGVAVFTFLGVTYVFWQVLRQILGGSKNDA